MKKLTILDLIKVDEYSITSKYLQIANSIIREIKNENIRLGDNLPSINELSFELDIARDTVERGYKHLKSIGIIDSVPRRGYFIKNIEFSSPLKIFLLFNKLSEHKKNIYDSFFFFLCFYEVIDFYNDTRKIIPNAVNKDTLLIQPLGLTKKEKDDLKNFLISLTDKRFKK